MRSIATSDEYGPKLLEYLGVEHTNVVKATIRLCWNEPIIIELTRYTGDMDGLTLAPALEDVKIKIVKE